MQPIQDLPAANKIAMPDQALVPAVTHEELRSYINDLCADHSDGVGIVRYFSERANYGQAITQDLLPLLVYLSVSEKHNHARAMPLAACWALYLAAAHFFDDTQDRGQTRSINDGIAAFGLANIALAGLEIGEDALRDILDAVGRAATLGAMAQRRELSKRNVLTRTDYFRNVIGKAAAIIATGAWIGGRMATEQKETLTFLKEFGMTLGLSIQIADDCMDLAEDLANGIYSLPVIEGLAMNEHPDYPALRALTAAESLCKGDTQEIIHLLQRMGAIAICKRMVGVYQAQVKAAFGVLPGLGNYFADYVAPDS